MPDTPNSTFILEIPLPNAWFFVTLAVAFLTWEWVLRPILLTPENIKIIKRLPSAWPHRKIIWKYRVELFNKRVETLPLLPDLLEQSTMETLGPYLEIMIQEQDRLLPHSKLLLKHLPAVKPHLGKFLELRAHLLPHMDVIARNCDALLPYMGELLDDSEVLIPHLPQLMLQMDQLAPYMAEIIELKPVLLPNIDILMRYSQIIGPNIGTLMKFRHKMLPHMDVMIRTMPYYVDYVNYERFPELIDYIDDLAPYMERLGPHAKLLLPHLHRVLPYMPIFIKHMDTLLPHLGKSIDHIDVLMDTFEWTIPRWHNLLEVPGVARVLPSIGAFLAGSKSSNKRSSRPLSSSSEMIEMDVQASSEASSSAAKSSNGKHSSSSASVKNKSKT